MDRQRKVVRKRGITKKFWKRARNDLNFTLQLLKLGWKGFFDLMAGEVYLIVDRFAVFVALPLFFGN